MIVGTTFRQAGEGLAKDRRSGHVETDSGDRRGRLSRLSPLRTARRARARRDLPGQLLHQPEIERQPPAGPAQFRAGPPRHHAADLPGGGRDLQPGLSGRPGPLPVQPHQDHEDLGAGGDPRAGDGQALPGQGVAGLDQRSLRRSAGPSPAGILSRRGQPGRARGRATTKESGPPKPCSWTTIAPTG